MPSSRQLTRTTGELVSTISMKFVNSEQQGTDDGHRDAIVAAIARTLSIIDWISRLEQRCPRALKRYAGRDLFEVAPPTSRRARMAADYLAGVIENLNDEPLDQMLARAMAVPGRHECTPTPASFGQSLTHEALGDGVTWADNHPGYPHRLPHIEYHAGVLYGLENIIPKTMF